MPTYHKRHPPKKRSVVTLPSLVQSDVSWGEGGGADHRDTALEFSEVDEVIAVGVHARKELARRDVAAVELPPQLLGGARQPDALVARRVGFVERVLRCVLRHHLRCL